MKTNSQPLCNYFGCKIRGTADRCFNQLYNFCNLYNKTRAGIETVELVKPEASRPLEHNLTERIVNENLYLDGGIEGI